MKLITRAARNRITSATRNRVITSVARDLAVGLSLLALTACAAREKTPETPAELMADYVPKLEDALGIKFKTPPKMELRSRDQVREFLLLKLKEPAIQKQFAEGEAVYKVLGLVPDTMHLTDLYVKVLTEQIMGYYDPKTKVLYMVEGAPPDYAGITMMHELVHALQDQYVNLDSLQSLTGSDDRALTLQALIEGQATYEQLYIMSGGKGNIAAQMPGGMDGLRDAIRSSTASQPMFSSAPLVIRETLLFPYINGFDFVRRAKDRAPKRFLFDSVPATSEQLMHNEAFFGKQRDEPSIVTLPRVPGEVMQNDFGEFGARIFIYAHTRDQDRSIRAAAGWDGDRFALVKTPSGNGIVWATVWDSPGDAAEFMSALDAVGQKRFLANPRVTGEKRRFETAKRTVEVDVREIGGRPVVLYTEVPAGESTNLIDFSKVTVTAR
jgi:hypothetical protein